MVVLLRRIVLLLLLAASLGSCTAPKGPVGFWSEHRYDRQLLPHGPWREYASGPPRQLLSRERFRHGRFVGRSRFYASDGTLDHQERYRRKPYGLMQVTYFHPNGRVLRTGQARLVAEPDGAHFYWFGEWPVYSATGQPVRVEFYEEGKLARVKQLRTQ